MTQGMGELIHYFMSDGYTRPCREAAGQSRSEPNAMPCIDIDKGAVIPEKAEQYGRVRAQIGRRCR